MKPIQCKLLLSVAALLVVTLGCWAADVSLDSTLMLGAGSSLAFIFTPVLWEPGSENMGGFEGRVLIVPEFMIRTRPELPAKAEIKALKDYVTAMGAYIFKESFKPIFVYCTENTVSYTAENQGEPDGQSFKVAGEFFHPGNSIEVAALARQINNTRCDLVLPDREGKQYLVAKARIKPSCDLGKAPSDLRGYKFIFEAHSFAPYVQLAAPIDFDELAEEAVNPNP